MILVVIIIVVEIAAVAVVAGIGGVMTIVAVVAAVIGEGGRRTHMLLYLTLERESGSGRRSSSFMVHVWCVKYKIHTPSFYHTPKLYLAIDVSHELYVVPFRLLRQVLSLSLLDEHDVCRHCNVIGIILIFGLTDCPKSCCRSYCLPLF